MSLTNTEYFNVNLYVLRLCSIQNERESEFNFLVTAESLTWIMRRPHQSNWGYFCLLPLIPQTELNAKNLSNERAGVLVHMQRTPFQIIMKLNLDCNYAFPIVPAPNRCLFDVKSIGKGYIQSKFWFNLIRFRIEQHILFK